MNSGIPFTAQLWPRFTNTSIDLAFELPFSIRPCCISPVFLPSPLPPPIHQAGYPGFWISVGLCNSVPSFTVVADSCGSWTALQAVESHDYHQLPGKHAQNGLCWYGGKMADISVTLQNYSNPCDGVSVSYGLSNCCPSDQVKPGVFNEVIIKARMTPAWGHCDDPDYVAVNTTELVDLHSVLYNCSSKKQVADLEFNVVASYLCPENIDWELDANATTFHCQLSSQNSDVECSVFPVCLRGGRSCSQYVCTYPHIILVFTNTSGESWNKTLAEMTDHFNGSCSFLYSAEGLQKILALYQYYDRPQVQLAGGNPFVRGRWSSDAFLKRSRYSVIFGPVALVVVLALLVFRYRRRKKNEGSAYRPLQVGDPDEEPFPASPGQSDPNLPRGTSCPVNVGRSRETEEVKLGATVSAKSGELHKEDTTAIAFDVPNPADKSYHDVNAAPARGTEQRGERSPDPQLVLAACTGHVDPVVRDVKKRSFCIVAHDRDKEWAAEEIKTCLKDIPNLHVEFIDCRRCGVTEIDAKTEAVETCDYVIVVVSRGVSTEVEESGSYSFMREKAEQRMVTGGKVYTCAKPFLVSRDGDMDMVPKNVDHYCCANFSSSEGWSMLRKAVEEHESKRLC